MKKTMFDVLEKTPEGIDEETVTPAYEISPEKVMEGVHAKLSADKKKGGKTNMKRSRRKTAVILAAAAVTVLALGTVTVGAMGGMNSFIGEHSAGEMVNNLYPGSNIELSVNENYKAEFTGISGDDTNMVSLVRIQNADGSDIIESGKDCFIESNDYYSYYDKNCVQTEEEVYDILDRNGEFDLNGRHLRKAKIWHTVGEKISDTTGPEFDNDAKAMISHSVWFRDPFDTTYPCFVSYEMADSKTVNCYLSSHIDSGLLQSLKGETLKAEDKDLYIYQIDKVLYETDSEEEFAYFSADYDRYNGLISENIKTLNDDQVITINNYSMVIATRKKIDIDMNLSVKLDYKSNTKEFSSDARFKGENGIEYTVSGITAGTLSADLKIEFTQPEGTDEYEAFSGLFNPYDTDGRIMLKNGKTINVEYGINRNYWERHTLTLYYRNSKDEYTAEWLMINPEEIESIEFNGTKITA